MELLSEWIQEASRPVIIAGPCSAESCSQVMETALELKKRNVDVYRAGIWKPRTRPDTFEGVGSEGLKWLLQVKQETGMKIATEVANVKHVYECLRYGVDVLWIGARTTANPFAVQEIADSLQGVDIPVMVKNPVNPDVDLWIGALERLNKAGIRKLAGIHRGFSSYGPGRFRNLPQWQIPVEMKRRMPQLPLICDPSHITGDKSLLREVSQKAMDLNFDGLMIEAHINPDEALSDKNQQVTPSEMTEIIESLILRKIQVDDRILKTTLGELRQHIDSLDADLIDTLAQRMVIADIIGGYKKESGITILQSDRWNEIMEKRLKNGTKKGLSRDFMTKLLQAIHQESINRQTLVMGK
ncbi:MAG: 3-deoxy-7-phosphoheptulonate synthase [Bacteroidetes bacterium GWF2_38_335]|nr:MAG: 3-deoxy-7-phosphoheptulonate synthase [Bacteroidetes bacterium GWF2_38_335]OFY80921.1 MAG: 3-deoxy-7-phosphoheptulonate synthase [Bacteroidetes bacterium RIFOXYA12_FULL_38_20]